MSPEWICAVNENIEREYPENQGCLIRRFLKLHDSDGFNVDLLGLAMHDGDSITGVRSTRLVARSQDDENAHFAVSRYDVDEWLIRRSFYSGEHMFRSHDGPRSSIEQELKYDEDNDEYPAYTLNGFVIRTAGGLNILHTEVSDLLVRFPDIKVFKALGIKIDKVIPDHKFLHDEFDTLNFSTLLKLYADKVVCRIMNKVQDVDKATLLALPITKKIVTDMMENGQNIWTATETAFAGTEF